MNTPFFQRLAALAYILAVAGCAFPLSTATGSTGLNNEEFGRYVENVFRLQNRMSSEVMMLNGERENYEALLKSEQHMQEVCSPLNEYVSREIDGLSKGFSLRRKVMKATLDCDRAAKEVQSMLKQ